MLDDSDIKKMTKVFATKHDLSRIIRDELEAQKPEWVRVIVETVTKILGDKIDKMYTKLDTFIGEIKARREEQTLHQGQHHQIEERLSRVEKKIRFSSIAD